MEDAVATGSAAQHAVVPPLRWKTLPQPSVNDLRLRFGVEAVQAAQAILASYEGSEPGITRDMSAAVGGSSKLYQADCRLKSLESLARKVRLRMFEDDVPAERGLAATVASELGDTARFTMVSDESQFCLTLRRAVNELESRQWRLGSADNFFVNGNRYKAVHLQFENAYGQAVELQAHTPRSAQIKSMTEPLYEIVRGQGASTYSQRLAAYYTSVEASASLQSPPGLDDVRHLGARGVQLRRRSQKPPTRRHELGERATHWQATVQGAVSEASRVGNVPAPRLSTRVRRETTHGR